MKLSPLEGRLDINWERSMKSEGTEKVLTI
jgi:hypothetical protein